MSGLGRMEDIDACASTADVHRNRTIETEEARSFNLYQRRYSIYGSSSDPRTSSYPTKFVIVRFRRHLVTDMLGSNVDKKQKSI